MQQPSLIVRFLINSVLKVSVFFDEIALTSVLFPCATCPIAPIFIVACLEITSGVRGLSYAVYEEELSQ
jgi:hypothetical protein